MSDDETIKPKSNSLVDVWACLVCKRSVHINELYGAFGMCSQCLATEGFDEHDGG